MTRACSERLLAAADRVRDAATRDPATHEPRPGWAAQAAERAARLAGQQAEIERSGQALAALPRRRGKAPRR